MLNPKCYDCPKQEAAGGNFLLNICVLWELVIRWLGIAGTMLVILIVCGSFRLWKFIGHPLESGSA